MNEPTPVPARIRAENIENKYNHSDMKRMVETCEVRRTGVPDVFKQQRNIGVCITEGVE
jgi:hypothetical protein